MSSEEMQELKNAVREVVAAEVGALRTEMNARFDEQQRQMDSRFNLVDKQVHELRTDVLDVHSKFSELQSSVDHYVLHTERVGHEQLSTMHAMERYERDFKRLGEATGVKLESAA